MIWASERVGSNQIEMIRKDKEITRFKILANTASRGRQNQRFHIEALQHAYWKCHRAEFVAFVVMKSSLHRCDQRATEVADNEISVMPRDSGSRKVWDMRVRDHDRLLQLIRELAHARTEDNPNLRYFADPLRYYTRRFLCVLQDL